MFLPNAGPVLDRRHGIIALSVVGHHAFFAVLNNDTYVVVGSYAHARPMPDILRNGSLGNGISLAMTQKRQCL